MRLPPLIYSPLPAFLAGMMLLNAAATAQDIVATPLHADGIYAEGETIQWQLSPSGLPGQPLVNGARYKIKENGLKVIASGDIPFVSGSGVLKTSLNEPGAVLVEITPKPWQSGTTNRQSVVGAVVDPFKIQPSSVCPADFDAFWKSKIEELKAIPPNPVVEPADSGDAAVDYFKVRLDNIGGSHVYGQLARLKAPGKFPAMLIFQYAGVYGLPKGNVTGPAKTGWLALNIMAHDLPLDQPVDYYNQIRTTTLNNYPSFGNDDREKSYFLRMFLGCYRAADYLASRPDWDGRILVVTGVSQGGYQSLVTAALHPKISAAIVGVPAGAESAGLSVGHPSAWPWSGPGQGANAAKIAETSLYFDTVNFAPRIKCPVMLGLGLIDQTCPPRAVFSAYNRIHSPKEVVVMVNSAHSGKNHSQDQLWAHSAAWLKALKDGGSVPPPQ